MIVDLFAGPGGWDEGLGYLGRTSGVVGVEMDRDACAVAEAAGHARILADVRTLDPRTVIGSEVLEGLIASPPCQTFSQAGKGSGRTALSDLIGAASLVMDGSGVADAMEANGLDATDLRSSLVLEPLPWVRDCRPNFIAFENVKGVLPVWEAYASLLSRSGYVAWAGRLNAADYGVPQSRTRAFLLAMRGTHLPLPTPTHSQDGGLFPRWVTFAEALDWPESIKPGDLRDWAWERPATTVVRSFCPDVIAAPGWRKPGDGPRQNTPGSIRVSERSMILLQGTREDYPFNVVAGKSKRQSLIGAILPPVWAAAILRPLLAASSVVCRECGNDDAAQMQDVCSDCLEEVI